jgi:hypothetical protein
MGVKLADPDGGMHWRGTNQSNPSTITLIHSPPVESMIVLRFYMILGLVIIMYKNDFILSCLPLASVSFRRLPVSWPPLPVEGPAGSRDRWGRHRAWNLAIH